MTRPNTIANADEWLWSRLKKSGDCWLWTGCTRDRGYGTVSIKGRQECAHRMAYELTHGKIPEGKILDHLCRQPACCNPDHLEVVTHKINILRGKSPSAINARKTHCRHGHAFTVENTRISRGGRYCRTCARIRWHKRKGA